MRARNWDYCFVRQGWVQINDDFARTPPVHCEQIDLVHSLFSCTQTCKYKQGRCLNVGIQTQLICLAHLHTRAVGTMSISLKKVNEENCKYMPVEFSNQNVLVMFL